MPGGGGESGVRGRKASRGRSGREARGCCLLDAIPPRSNSSTATRSRPNLSRRRGRGEGSFAARWRRGRIEGGRTREGRERRRGRTRRTRGRVSRLIRPRCWKSGRRCGGRMIDGVRGRWCERGRGGRRDGWREGTCRGERGGWQTVRFVSEDSSGNKGNGPKWRPASG